MNAGDDLECPRLCRKSILQVLATFVLNVNALALLSLQSFTLRNPLVWLMLDFDKLNRVNLIIPSNT